MGFSSSLMPYKNIQDYFKQLLLLFVICCFSPSFAGTFVVDDSYNGLSSASACEQPAGAQFFSTIAAARVVAATLPAPHTIRICPGSYTENNTFNNANYIGMVIEGTTGNANDVVINGASATSGTTIYLRQVRMTLRNLTLAGGWIAGRTYTNGVVPSNNTFSNLIIRSQGRDGLLIQSSHTTVTDVHVENSSRFGIYVTGSVDNLTVESSTVASSTFECLRSNGGNVVIRNVSVKDCGRYAVFLNKTAGTAEGLLIDTLNVAQAGNDGLYIRNYDATASTDSISVSNVAIDTTGRYGLFLHTVKSAYIDNIKIDTVARDGVGTVALTNSKLSSIGINNAASDGLYMNNASANNGFSEITITNSNAYGVYLNGSDNNEFNGLDVRNSNGTFGFYLVNTALNNTVNDYKIYNNNIGLAVNNSRNNTFRNGHIHNNNDGVRLYTNAQDNLLTNNFITENVNFGLRVLATGTNTNNSIYQNCFINAAINMDNYETGLTTNFDNGTIGNFYGSIPAGSGYSETCTDTDTNNICDAPYTIPGGFADVDNFPSKALSSINAACTASSLLPNISFQKTSKVESNLVNLTVNPKAIPGAIVEYTLTINNTGPGASDNDTVVINDLLPANTRFVFGSPLEPVTFVDGSPVSGLSYTFASLASATDDIQFSNNGGASFITPVVGGDGVDATSPAINYIRVIPKGSLNPDTGSGSPSFLLRYRVRID